MKVLVYSFSNNPYQYLLYREIKMRGVQVISLRGSIFDKHALLLGLPLFCLRLLFHRLNGYSTLHLHWLSPFGLPYNYQFARFISTIYLLYFLISLKLLKIKLVWTIHNILPHRRLFINDSKASKITAKFADAKIVHSKHTIEEMQGLGFDITNTIVIPHGNYIDYYPNSVTKHGARAILKIDRNKFVYLFFGMVKKYKGIDKLLEYIDKLDNEDIVLVIAGKCEDDDLKNLISQYEKKSSGKIKVYLKHIKDNEVQNYFNAADVVVLPFYQNTTSGSAILSLSFSKPIIAPRIGSIIEFPPNTGIYYDSNDTDGLFNAIKESYIRRDILSEYGINGYEYIKKITWGEVADMTLNVYQSLHENI